METHTPNIVFVDDERAVLEGIRRLLHGRSRGWQTHFAESVDDGIALAQGSDADLIVTDMAMRHKTGFDLLAEVREHPVLRHVPVIVLTGSAEASQKRRALEHGALDLINKPISGEDLVARIGSALRLSLSERRLRDHAATLERRVLERTEHLDHARREVIWRLARAGEMRDADTGDHVVRVSDCSAAIAIAFGLSADAAAEIGLAATLHDVGKVAISDVILRKPGLLTEEETAQMREHCRLGFELLTSPLPLPLPRGGDNRILHVAASIALRHHERWDGSGYPDGLSGGHIPLEARIVAFADALDAVCRRRPYKEAMPFESGLSRLCADSGTHFDPGVVEAACRCAAQLRAIVSPSVREEERLGGAGRDAA